LVPGGGGFFEVPVKKVVLDIAQNIQGYRPYAVWCMNRRFN